MPLDYQVDEPARLVVARMTGEVDVASVLAHIEALKQDERLEPGFRFYYDLSKAMPGPVDGALIRMAAETSAVLEDRFGDCPLAIVAPADAAYGLSRMFGSLTDTLRRPIEVFRTEAEAREWLGAARP